MWNGDKLHEKSTSYYATITLSPLGTDDAQLLENLKRY